MGNNFGKDLKELEEELKKQHEEYCAKLDEASHKCEVTCCWTYCGDNSHMPTENGKYLICDSEGDYDVVDFFKKGSVIKSHEDHGYRIDMIADKDAFFFFRSIENRCPIEYDNVIGYIKISDINVYKVGEKHG